MKNFARFIFSCILFSTFNIATATVSTSFAQNKVSTISGNAGGDLFGRSVSNAGDINNDGYGDIIIGASGKYSNQGAVYVIYGKADFALSSIDLSTALNPHTTGFTIMANAPNDQLGWAVSGAGDVNNDGYDDIVIGASYKSGNRGALYVIYGGTNTNMKDIDLTTDMDPHTTGFKITQASGTDDYLGYSVSSAGDMDKDGFDDILIGAWSHDASTGIVYVIYGRDKASFSNIDVSSGTLNSGVGFTIKGSAAGDYLGWSVSNAGDVNGDGFDDIIVGAKRAIGKQGAAYVIYGRARPLLANMNVANLSPATTGFKITGESGINEFGSSVSGAGDVNHDGFNEIIIGAFLKGSSKGAAYVIYGGATLQNIDLSAGPLDPATKGFMITGEAANDQFGLSVSSAGDLNKDTYDDIIVGAPGKSESGAVYVIYGAKTMNLKNINLGSEPLIPAATGFIVLGDAASDKFGFSVSNAGDVDKDGFEDILVGAYAKSSSKGVVYVLTYNRCADHCSDCLFPSRCNACSTGYSVSNNECSSSCLAGYYFSEAATPNCQPCSDHCTVCTSGTTCTTCTSAWFLLDGGCVQNCPLETVPSASGKECLHCPTDCDVCTDENTCTTCTGSLIMYRSHCYSSCPATSYPLGGVCLDCPAKCDQCLDGSQCLVCTSPWLLSDDQCVQTCPDKTVASSSATECLHCPDHCERCTDADTCTACTSPFMLSKGKCFDSCPDRTTPSSSNTECLDCPDNCQSCSDPTVCDVCLSLYYKYASQCVTCQDLGTYISGSDCLDCPNNCNVCSNFETCLTCSNSYFLYHSSQCVTCQDVGQYKVGSECLDCPNNCDVCTDSATCTTCTNLYFKYHSQCVEACEEPGTYISGSNCFDCSENCDTCSNFETCTTCSGSYKMYHSQCVETCPDGTYLSGSECHDCSANCASCQDSNSCQACSNGALLWDAQCIASCPLKTYNSGSVCKACPNECSECTSEFDCQTCAPGFGKLGSKCTLCPPAFYLSSGICSECSSGCMQCKNATICEQCAEDYTLTESHLCSEEVEIPAKDKAGPALFESASLLGSSLSSGSSLPLNFGLVAKILRNIKYLDVPVSPELQKTFFSWKVASGFMSAPKSWSKKSHSKYLPGVFSRYKLEPVFLINYWKPFMMTLIGAALYGIFKTVEMYLEKKNQQKSKFYSISKQIHVTASNFALTQFYSNLDDAVLYFVLELKSTEFDGAFRVFSCGLAIILLFTGGMILAVHSSLLNKYQAVKKEQKAQKGKQLDSFAEKYENMKLVFKDFKDINFFTQSFLLVNLIRALISSLIIGVLFEHPVLQIVLLLILNLAMLSFLIMKKPFKERTDTCGQIFCELVLLVANISTLIMATFEENGSRSYDTIERLSQCIIVLNWILLVGCALLLFISIGKALYSVYKEKKNPKLSSLSSDKSSSNDLLSSTKFNRPSQNNRPSDSVLRLESNDLSSLGLNNQSNPLETGYNASFDNSNLFSKQMSQGILPNRYDLENSMSVNTDIDPVRKASNEPLQQELSKDLSSEGKLSPNLTYKSEGLRDLNQGNTVSRTSEQQQAIRRRRGKIRILGTMNGNLNDVNGSPNPYNNSRIEDESAMNIEIINLGNHE